MITLLLAAAIALQGVEGNGLRARAFFDANNVKVGDPLILTIDFLGEADFKDLHPPALSRCVSRRDWKLDDVSAKTDTYRNARRLTYRVRPMREGVLWFPSLEFEYQGPDGRKRLVRANDIPVHAKVGAQVVVEEMGEDRDAKPQPPELVTSLWPVLGDVVGEGDDELAFAWSKAHAKPTADAFAAFDFPAARMNEATCAIREGNWARAMKIYQRLEWTTGQTPEIEQGIVAALALRYDNAAVELPVWRQVLRPILVFGWKGRVGIVVGGFAALAFLFWLLGRGIRAVACLALAAGCAFTAGAQGFDPSAHIRQMHQMMNQMMSTAVGSQSQVFVNGVRQEPVKLRVTVKTEPKEITVGEPFDFIVSIEVAKRFSLDSVNMSVPDVPGLELLSDRFENLTNGTPANPSNVVRRLSIPARSMKPFKGPVTFTASGEASPRNNRRRGAFGFFEGFVYSESFSQRSVPMTLEVKPLPVAGQPADFSGIVADSLRVHETCNILNVETNDVVTISYRMFSRGYVPPEFLPKDAAYEWMRYMNRERQGEEEIEYRRYFVADGTEATPELTISYYDPRTRSYKTVRTGGTRLHYVPAKKP